MTTWLNASFEMRFRFIGGLTVRFAASEDHGDHALLLSPWPESLLAFEPVWWRLAQRTHLVAVDLPGFGHSQRSDSLLSPQAMGEFIIAAADAFGLEHPHVVAPGTGTAAALFAAARHPGRLRSLVVGSGAAAVPLQLGGMVKDIIEAPDLDGFRRADPRQLVNAALSGISRYTLPEAVRDDYLASYQGNRFAESARYLRSYPAELPVLAGLLPQIRHPGADHRRRRRYGGAAGQRQVPARAAAAQQARRHRRGPLHLGRRRSRIRGPGHQLVARRGQRIKEMSTMPGPDHDTAMNLPTTALPPVTAGQAPGCGLHGRRGECEMLDRLVTDVRAGQSRVLVLRGEPGTGKTALLDYLAQRAAGCRRRAGDGRRAGNGDGVRRAPPAVRAIPGPTRASPGSAA